MDQSNIQSHDMVQTNMRSQEINMYQANAHAVTRQVWIKRTNASELLV